MRKIRTDYERTPKLAKVNSGEAWWYALGSGIELHVTGCGGHHTVMISRAAIREYVKKRKAIGRGKRE